MEHQKLPYIEAIKQICRDHNIRLQEDDVQVEPDEKEYTDELWLLNRETAKKFYENRRDLVQSHPANVELLRRGYTADDIIDWKIGYALDEWQGISSPIVSAGKYRHGLELGLLKTKGERNYDIFRHRLIFPIEDERERIVGFGGRYLDGAVNTAFESDEKPPKYINSPASKIYDKSHVLYGLAKASHSIRKNGNACLVEGYTDVISMHKAGIDNTVGSCGTALTEQQCALLKRYTENVILFYDGDAAGKRATLRAIDMLLQHGIETQVMILPEGKDPDDFSRMFQPVEQEI
jgi:DNA primase